MKATALVVVCGGRCHVCCIDDHPWAALNTTPRIDKNVVASSLHYWVIADHGTRVVRLVVVVLREHVGTACAFVVRLVSCHVVVLLLVVMLLLEMVADAQRAISPIVNACGCLMKRRVVLDLITSLGPIWTLSPGRRILLLLLMVSAALVRVTHDIPLRVADHHLILLYHSRLSHNDLTLFLTPFPSLRCCTRLLHTQFAISVSVLSFAKKTFLGGRVWGSAAIASFRGARLAVGSVSVVGLVDWLLLLVLLIVMLLLDHQSVLAYQSSSLKTFMTFTVF